MRILGMSERWDKLETPLWTTFRFTRKDRDWEVGEKVKVVYKPRRKGGGELLGIATILSKEFRAMALHGDNTGCQKVTNAEAILDGFFDIGNRRAYFAMYEFLFDSYGGERLLNEPMNKLTLKWGNEVESDIELTVHPPNP